MKSFFLLLSYLVATAAASGSSLPTVDGGHDCDTGQLSSGQGQATLPDNDDNENDHKGSIDNNGETSIYLDHQASFYYYYDDKVNVNIR
ncbi:hypothetical protein FOPE_09164 [Fonsecaea pedrosoi]|nr:hypothetical protein FOPE_09164 [Fonsecaea pedrosoi]